MNHLRKALLVISFVSFMMLPHLSGAEEVLGFNDNLRYNIYFAGEDSEIAVITNAKIEGVRTLGVKTFLVITSTGLKFNEGDGFILLDSVVAILPEGNFNVRGTGRTIK